MPRSIPRFLAATASRLPDKVAVVGATESLTFSQLHEAALATAACLVELGVRPGDRVGMCMEKSIDQIRVALGTLYANAVLVPILPRLKPVNIAHIVRNSGMSALVADASRMNEVESFKEETKLVVGHGEVEETWPNLPYIARHIQASAIFDRIGVDNAAIIYSSGSTGRPKGILISHRNLADGAEIASSYLGTTEDDRIACILSFNFDYGLNQIWQMVLKGATLYLHDLALPNDLFKLLDSQRITALPVMPVIVTQMFDPRLYRPDSNHDYSSLRYVCSTGGRISSRMIDDLRTAFPSADIYSMFGLTEAFRATFLAPERLATHPTSIGKAIPGCEVLVLDAEGNECPPGVPGELVQRGATVSKCYWNDPENTARVFRTHPRYPGETLVFSGDEVMRDEDGYLYFVSRKDEMIKTRGFRVSPTEVESEVLTHDQVESAVAYGRVNIEIGEDIVCAYTTKTGEPVPDRVLRQYLKGRLAPHMVPAALLHFDSFPITGSGGKIDRTTVKKAADERIGVQATEATPHGAD